MRKLLIVLLACLAVIPALCGVWAASAAAVATPAEGGSLPDISLPLPQRVEERSYLGIEKGPFNLSQIGAQVLIIEIFSMYCPYCQREAPQVNELHRAISKRGMDAGIKVIGIGAGNSAFEVDAFKKLYGISFPLFPDPAYSVHQQVGEVRTPYFFVVVKDRKGPNRIIYSKAGTMGDPEAFLNMVIDKAGPR